MKKITRAFNNQPFINLKDRKYILNPLINHLPNTPLERIGVKIYAIIAVAEKIDYHGRERIKKETGYDVKCLLKISCSGKKSVVVLDK